MFFLKVALCVVLAETHVETGAALCGDEVCFLQLNRRTDEGQRSTGKDTSSISSAGSDFYPDAAPISPWPQEAYRSSCTYLTGVQCQSSASHCWYHSQQCISMCHKVDYRLDLARHGKCDSSPNCHVRGSQCEENCDKFATVVVDGEPSPCARTGHCEEYQEDPSGDGAPQCVVKCNGLAEADCSDLLHCSYSSGSCRLLAGVPALLEIERGKHSQRELHRPDPVGT
jgi:hypothetical protein